MVGSRRDGRTSWSLLVASAGMTVVSSAVAATMSFPAQDHGTSSAAPRLAAMYQLPPVPIELPAPGVAPTQAAGPETSETTAPRPPAAPPPETAEAVAVTQSSCSGAGWEQRRGQAAHDQLRYVAATRAVPVVFRSGSDVLGMADFDTRSVEVFVRSCASESDALLRHVLAHELGHVLDELRMDDQKRAQWREVRGIPAGTPWYGCSACPDFATPAGDFAEVYAQWARGATSNRSRLAGAPGPDALERLAAQFFGA